MKPVIKILNEVNGAVCLQQGVTKDFPYFMVYPQLDEILSRFTLLIGSRVK